MSEALERLKQIGSQKIANDTHIPVEHVQAILYESFEDLTKVQFIGFISILEREYKEDLGDVRERFINYFNEIDDSDQLLTNDTIFKAPEKKLNLKPFYLTGIAFLLIGALFYYTNSKSKIIPKDKEVSQEVQKVEEHKLVTPNKEEQNTTMQESKLVVSSDVNESKPEVLPVVKPVPKVEKKKLVEQPTAIKDSFEIIARKKVWLGYIDVKKHKKYQKIFLGKLSLDPQKEWLLYFGHGMIDLVVDGKKEKLSLKTRVRFHYKDGKVTPISLAEFKRLNRGKAW